VGAPPPGRAVHDRAERPPLPEPRLGIREQAGADPPAATVRRDHERRDPPQGPIGLDPVFETGGDHPDDPFSLLGDRDAAIPAGKEPAQAGGHLLRAAGVAQLGHAGGDEGGVRRPGAADAERGLPGGRGGGHQM